MASVYGGNNGAVIKCSVSNRDGAVTESGTATLTVIQIEGPPRITKSPSSIIVMMGKEVILQLPGHP